MSTLSSKKYHYFYKITMNNSPLFYYGIHSTDNLNDNYMGSGGRLIRFYKMYGKHLFKKEILNFFNTRKEASDYEHKIVNENVLKNPNCLNLVIGGDLVNDSDIVVTTKGLVTVRDKNGKCFDVSVNDPRYLSHELESCNKGFVVVRDDDGRCFRIRLDNPDYIAGKYKSINEGNDYYKGKTTIYKDGEYKTIDKKDFKNYEVEGWIIQSKCKGRVSPTKGLVHLLKGDKSIMVKREEMQKYLDEGWENKRNVRPLINTICINKDGRHTFIDKKELPKYIEDGWSKGGLTRNKGKLTCSLDDGKTYTQLDIDDERVKKKLVKVAISMHGSPSKNTKYMNKDGITKRVKLEFVDEYLRNGWCFGNKSRKYLSCR